MPGELAVRVDRDFARFGKKTYAINKINSVEVRERRPHGSTGAIILGLLVIIFLMLAIQNTDGSGPTDLLVAFLCAGGTYWAWKRSTIVEYQLFLMTSSSEAQAIASRDGGMIESLRDRIERAMAGRLE